MTPNKPRRSPLKLTAGGLVDPDEFPDTFMENMIIDFISSQPRKTYPADEIAESVFKFTGMKHRAVNKERMIEKIWGAIDVLIDSARIEQYQTQKKVRLRLKQNNN